MTGPKAGKGVKTFHTWSLRYADPAVLKEAVQAAVPEADVRCHSDTNTLVVGGTHQVQAAVHSLVKRLDVPARQVDVSVEVASVDDSLLKQTGMEWNWSTVEGGADHDVFSLTGTIHALEEKGRAQILASPHMVASNGREAHILIGDKVPVQTEHLSGKETAVSTTYEEAGIKLTYTPQIHPDDSVTAQLVAEVSTPVLCRNEGLPHCDAPGPDGRASARWRALGHWWSDPPGRGGSFPQGTHSGVIAGVGEIVSLSL